MVTFVNGRRIGESPAVPSRVGRSASTADATLREGVFALSLARAIAIAFLGPYLVWVKPPHAVILGAILAAAALSEVAFAWRYLRAAAPLVPRWMVLLSIQLDVGGILVGVALADGARSSIVPFITPLCVVAAVWFGLREAALIGATAIAGIAGIEIADIAPVVDVTGMQRATSLAVALAVTILVGSLIARAQAKTRGALNEAERVARIDPLTGLLNRLALSERIDFELAQAMAVGNQYAAILVDIDDFKQFNTRLGYLEGDRVLTRVAGLIAAERRRSDLAIRLGGEEFLLLVETTSAADAEALAARICASTARDRSGPPVTVSVGISVAPGHGTRPAELVRSADIALRAAKAAGKNRSFLFSPTLTQPAGGPEHDLLRQPGTATANEGDG